MVLDEDRHNELNPIDRAILTYAGKLTRTPGKMGEQDVEQLRAEGLKDRAILDICQITSYFNFINRMADGLGAVLEEEYR